MVEAKKARKAQNSAQGTEDMIPVSGVFSTMGDGEGRSRITGEDNGDAAVGSFGASFGWGSLFMGFAGIEGALGSAVPPVASSFSAEAARG
jgi:hypothetical protein